MWASGQVVFILVPIVDCCVRSGKAEACNEGYGRPDLLLFSKKRLTSDKEVQCSLALVGSMLTVRQPRDPLEAQSIFLQNLV